MKPFNQLVITVFSVIAFVSLGYAAYYDFGNNRTPEVIDKKALYHSQGNCPAYQKDAYGNCPVKDHRQRLRLRIVEEDGK